MKKFTKRLKGHPGVPIAAALTLLGFVAGGVFGAAVLSVFWVLVLWTAWDQP